MSATLLNKIWRVAQKDPRYVARRLVLEARIEAEQFFGPSRARRVDPARLAGSAGHASVDAWWAALAQRPFPGRDDFDATAFRQLCPASEQWIIRQAGKALANEVDLLGSGPLRLGDSIDWHADQKTGTRWAPQFHRHSSTADSTTSTSTSPAM
jgi:hypothetical protein